LRKTPEITSSDIAKKLKTKPNNLYRVLGDLEKAKRVKKQGTQVPPAS
jgi:DNA-binding MarR family transcriptional regulator